MMKPSKWAAIAAPALLAACAPEPGGNAATREDSPANATDIIVPPEAPNAAANVSNAADEAAGLTVNLAPDELTLVDANGSARHLPFGADKAAAIRMVSAALGSPVEQAANQDCGAGPLGYAAFRDGLSLYFEGDKFAGWDLDGRENGKFTTAAGIGIGSTRKQMEAVAQVTVEESSIGHEFSMGDISGVLAMPGPDGKVTNLWAGVTCIAR